MCCTFVKCERSRDRDALATASMRRCLRAEAKQHIANRMCAKSPPSVSQLALPVTYTTHLFPSVATSDGAHLAGQRAGDGRVLPARQQRNAEQHARGGAAERRHEQLVRVGEARDVGVGGRAVVEGRGRQDQDGRVNEERKDERQAAVPRAVLARPRRAGASARRVLGSPLGGWRGAE
jgi:hypothetical protein